MRLADLVKDGKIYLSLSDALALALENNYDIAIARYDLDIADTDILRTRTGAAPLGMHRPASSRARLSGSQATLVHGRRSRAEPSAGSGGAGSGPGGLTLYHSGRRPAAGKPRTLRYGYLQFDRATSPSSSFFTGGNSTTNTYNFGYNQGFVTGTAFQFTWDNNRSTSTNAVTTYSPAIQSSFKAQVTQHLLQGAGIWVNKRFIYQALNNRRITDSVVPQSDSLHRQPGGEHLLGPGAGIRRCAGQGASSRAEHQARQPTSRSSWRSAPWRRSTWCSADSTVATDKQALISSQSSLNYQQQIIKQAIARNLNDPALVAAPIIPTDRVSLDPIPEEQQTGGATGPDRFPAEARTRTGGADAA